MVILPSGTQSEFERRLLGAEMKAVVVRHSHQTDRYEKPVAADLRDQIQCRVDPQPEQLIGAPLRKGLLELPAGGHHLLRSP